MALSPLPSTFGATVRSLHAVAEQIIAPARKPDNEIALMATPGGFGTPPFAYEGAQHQIRVEGADLVDGNRRAVITSLDEARAAVVAELVPQPLDDAAAGDDPIPAPILWPEHFDIAIELGAEGSRANYGVSPGDADHAEPYLYVGPWTAPPAGELWNAQGFPGAELTYSDLIAAAEPRAAALDFFRTRKEAL